jgi:hypothetical protein
MLNRHPPKNLLQMDDLEARCFMRREAVAQQRDLIAEGGSLSAALYAARCSKRE